MYALPQQNTIVITSSGGGGGPSISVVSLGGDSSTDIAADTLLKRFSFNPGDWAVAGKTTSFTLRAVGRVTNVATTGTVEVWDLTDGSTVGHVDFTLATNTEQTTALVFDAATHLYQCVFRLAGGAVGVDYFPVSAQLVITWT